MNFLFFFRGSNRSIVHSHQTFLEGVKRHPCIRIPYCWWKKSGWPVEVGSWSHYFQGFKNIQKVVGLGISEPSTVFTFYMKRNIVKDSCWILLMLQKSINKLRITSLYIYISHTIHVWYIFLHLPIMVGWVYHPPKSWACFQVKLQNAAPAPSREDLAHYRETWKKLWICLRSQLFQFPMVGRWNCLLFGQKKASLPVANLPNFCFREGSFWSFFGGWFCLFKWAMKKRPLVV